MSGELAARLAETVTVLRPVARDALGGAGPWEGVSTCRAAMVPEGGARAEAGGGVAGLGRWRATVRHPRDVHAGDRLLWAGRRLRVTLVVRDGRRPDRIEIYCEEER